MHAENRVLHSVRGFFIPVAARSNYTNLTPRGTAVPKCAATARSLVRRNNTVQPRGRWRVPTVLRWVFCTCCFVPTIQAAPFIPVPDALSPDNPRFPLVACNVPAPGGVVTDSRLGTSQQRVVASEGVRHEYSRHDPFNKDGKFILLLELASGRWNCYRTDKKPYDRESNFVQTLEVEEPRWDAGDPHLIWATQEFCIMQIRVPNEKTTVVKDFREDPVIGPILKKEPDLYRITMKDEGEASLDRRYWAFILQGTKDDYRARYLLVWDRSEDCIVGLHALTNTQSNIDWVGMSPLGNWVLIGGDFDNGAPLAGLVMANRALKTFHPLHYSTGHADVGLDAKGHEVIVMQNAQTDYIDMIPLEPATRPIPPNGGYAGSGHVPLVRLFSSSESPMGLNSGVHISCNFSGWCVVSTYIEPNTREQNWLDRTIALVRLDRDRPRAYYLAKVYGTCGTYWEETHATISADGSRVVWATNWGKEIGKEKVWDVELNMPVGWEGLMK